MIYSTNRTTDVREQ